MERFNFYYVSLSDGDASLRVRFIDSPIFNDVYISNGHSEMVNPYSTLHFIISGDVTVNGKKIHKGQAFYEDSYPKEDTKIRFSFRLFLRSKQDFHQKNTEKQ